MSDQEPKGKADGPFYGGPIDKELHEKMLIQQKEKAEEREKKRKAKENKKKSKVRKVRKAAAAQPKKAGFGDVPDIITNGEVDIPESFWVNGNPWKDKLEDKENEK